MTWEYIFFLKKAFCDFYQRGESPQETKKTSRKLTTATAEKNMSSQHCSKERTEGKRGLLPAKHVTVRLEDDL